MRFRLHVRVIFFNVMFEYHLFYNYFITITYLKFIFPQVIAVRTYAKYKISNVRCTFERLFNNRTAKYLNGKHLKQ